MAHSHQILCHFESQRNLQADVFDFGDVGRRYLESESDESVKLHPPLAGKCQIAIAGAALPTDARR